ncbi:AcrR family transcriptional regulator [Thermocatellispora tengchongensis]|uniref:AcrR family transcriptional regulator n=1 Tax=Thermocatellispora tengchongensis TaxID=1073253 RepID=A0A840P916_9ACTN|nr:TetR/AcrR family transcriptional regulator [Thermocatellispora tengchongensis]MBB5135489.1 AcrR family transcriptional regulator [Thermocatellispora tengchongensis]
MARESKIALDRPDMRAHVLKAALLAIEEVGFARLRIRDIADRAGMSTGHVLYYFGSRDRILVSTLLMSEADLDERRRAELAHLDAHAALDRLVELYLPKGPHDVRWRLWAQVIARPPEDEETLLRLDGFFRSWAAELAAIVRRLSDLGAEAAEDFAVRHCRLMDGLSNEVLLGIPGHDAAWAKKAVLASMRRELG